MKSTGIGRIVLPIELRRVMNIGPSDGVEIYVEGERIVLQKHERTCIFCGSAENTVEYMGKCVCKDCAKKIGKEKGAVSPFYFFAYFCLVASPPRRCRSLLLNSSTFSTSSCRARFTR